MNDKEEALQQSQEPAETADSDRREYAPPTLTPLGSAEEALAGGFTVIVP